MDALLSRTTEWQPDAAAPLVSIVIDNFNYGRFLRRSIGSALLQTYHPLEVVVVDDASTDDSREVIRSYANAVVPVLKPDNEGHGAAFNSGFFASRGDIVLFLDADDYLYPDAVAKVVHAWRPGVAKIQYRLNLLDASGSKLDVYPAPEIAFDSGDVVPLLLRQGRYETPVTSGNAFARAALERVLPMPAQEFRQGGDGYLVTVAPLFGTVISLDEALGAYCQHGTNHSDFARQLAERARWRIDHDHARHRALARKAAELGLSMLPEAALRDATHIESRISSLCLDPERHPVPADTRAELAVRGAWSTRHLNVAARRKALLAAWFLCVGLLPRVVARTVLKWRIDQRSRPWLVATTTRVLRRASR